MSASIPVGFPGPAPRTLLDTAELGGEISLACRAAEPAAARGEV